MYARWPATSGSGPPPPSTDGETVHVIKGGCYNDPAELLRGDGHLLAAPKDKFETIGFRCVKPA